MLAKFYENGLRFKQQREEYLKKFALHNKECRKKWSDDAMQHINAIIRHNMTTEDVENYGKSIVTEFEADTKKESYSKQLRTLSGSQDLHYMNCNPKKISSFFEDECKKQELQYSDRSPQNELYEKYKDGELCQKLYYYCVDKLKSLGIQIVGVNKNFADFRRYERKLGFDYIYLFECIKGDYTFNAFFAEDADCVPGILNIRSVTNMKTHETLQTYCDLFTQNTSKEQLSDLMLFLNCSGFEEYYKIQTQRYDEIAELLKTRGLNVSVKREINEVPCKKFSITCESNLGINDGICEYYLTISSPMGECCIVPDVHDKTHIHLYETIEQHNAKYTQQEQYEKRYKGESIFETKGIRDTYSSLFIGDYDSWIVNYSDKNDIDSLARHINRFIAYITGSYGVYDSVTKKYKNGTDICRCARIASAKYKNTNITLSATPITQDGHDFDATILCYTYSGTVEHITKIDDASTFPCDFYKIHVWYEQEVDTQCHLSIESKFYNALDGKYHWFNELKPESNKDAKFGDLYDTPSDDEQPKVCDLFETFVFSGTYDECRNIVENFVDNVMQW